MEHWIEYGAHVVAISIEAMAIVVIAAGSIEAFVAGARSAFSADGTVADRRAIWVRYARWLVAGLTFQLAADIVHTSIAPSWDEVGRLGAIAVIRTFLSYFLDRDMGEMNRRLRGREHESAGEPPK